MDLKKKKCMKIFKSQKLHHFIWHVMVNHLTFIVMTSLMNFELHKFKYLCII